MTRDEITKRLKGYGWAKVRWDSPRPGYVEVSERGGYWHVFARSEQHATDRLRAMAR